MSPDLQPLIDLLGGSHGKLAAAFAWIGALRLAAKPISGVLQLIMSRLLAFVAGTPEEDDDHLVLAILKSRTYRTIAFLVDLIASIKLPTSASVTNHEKTP